MDVHQLTQALAPVMGRLRARHAEVDASAAIFGLERATTLAATGGLGSFGLADVLAAVKTRAITESQHRGLSEAARKGATALLTEAFETIGI